MKTDAVNRLASGDANLAPSEYPHQLTAQFNTTMKRRQFLRAAAFTGAGCLILPRLKLLGADAPSNKLNIALIGTWGRAEAHFNALKSENVVALCDVDEKHLAFGAERFPGAKHYFDWRQCLDQKGLDAVVCATTDHTHAFIANWSLNRGLHIY